MALPGKCLLAILARRGGLGSLHVGSFGALDAHGLREILPLIFSEMALPGKCPLAVLARLLGLGRLHIRSSGA